MSDVVAGAAIQPFVELAIDYVRGRLRTAATARMFSAIRAALGPQVLDPLIAQWSSAEPDRSPEFADAVARYVRSREFATVLNQLFLIRLAQSSTLELGPIQKENSLLGGRFLSGFDGGARTLERLFAWALQAVDTALIDPRVGDISDAGVQQEAERVFLRSHLASISRAIAALEGGSAVDEGADAAFEGLYRHQVLFRHRNITPPNSGAARPVPLEDIYVLPHLSRAGVDGEISYGKLCRQLGRTVVLGDPGGGKSTLSAKLVADCARPLPESCGGPLAGLTPALVVMRDYGAWKVTHGGTILDFVSAIAASKYQCKAPDGYFERKLLSGSVLVVFDGLDELLDTSIRRELVGDVEAFANRYPAAAIVVTSRRVGYDEAPLDPSFFTSLHLGGFRNADVEVYARKWFALDAELSPDEQFNLAEAFLDDSAIVADLRVNPLMLALMCNIYRGERYIPSNRPEVYEKCSMMLFERWDRERGIKVKLAIESLVKPAMMYLAHEIYSGAGGDRTVSRSWLVNSTVDYLIAKGRFTDRDEAAAAAGELIEFCTGRAWVFSDVGLDADDEPLYEFTHGTFLEFFAASHLVRLHPTPEELAAVLVPRLEAAEWDVAAQLALQIVDKNVEDGGSRFLASILGDGDAIGGNIPFFAARSLGYVYPSIDVLGTIVDRSLPADFPARITRIGSASHHASCCEQLLGSQQENYSRLKDRLAQALVARVEAGDRRVADFVLHCDVGNLDAPSERLNDIRRLADSAMADLLSRGDLGPFVEDRLLAVTLLERGFTTVDQMVEHHGLDPLLVERPSVALRGSARFISSAAAYVDRYSQRGFSGTSAAERRLLGEIGNWVAEHGQPCFAEHHSNVFFGRVSGDGEVPSADEVATPAEFFALCVLAGAIVESGSEVDLEGGLLASFAPFIEARDNAALRPLNVDLPWLAERPDLAALLMDWANGAVDLAQPA